MSCMPRELEAYLATLLGVSAFADYCPNGLQVEGGRQIRRLAVGVTANLALLEAAREAEADAVLVHHGLFWNKDPRTLTGWRAARVRSLMQADQSLFAYHLPLDAHPEFGNNAGMLRAMALEPTEPLTVDGLALGFVSRLSTAMTALEVIERVEAVTGREPLVFGDPDQPVATIGMISGGGAGYYEAARRAGVDLFITGEAAESSQAMSEELGGMFVAAGHHATERFGVELLGRHLVQTFGVELMVIDIDNPV